MFSPPDYVAKAFELNPKFCEELSFLLPEPDFEKLLHKSPESTQKLLQETRDNQMEPPSNVYLTA